MVGLLLILFVVVLSILLYVLRQHKITKEEELSFWSSSIGSSYPPPNSFSSQSKIPAETLQNSLLKDASPREQLALSQQQQHSPSFYIQSTRKRATTQDNIPVTDFTKTQLDDYLEKSSSSKMQTLLTGSGHFAGNKNYLHTSAGPLIKIASEDATVYSDALRVASLEPEEVVYLNDYQWFHPGACERYPSKTTLGEELLVTIKGSWILKKPGPTYELIGTGDAFIFLETNGFEEIAAQIAPHNPSNEL